MSQHEPLSPELKALEAALAGLTPTAARLDRDRLMFEAGRSAAARRRWAWPAAAAVLAIVAVWSALRGPGERGMPPIAGGPSPPGPIDSAAVALPTAYPVVPDSYLELRRHWATDGFAAFDAAAVAKAPRHSDSASPPTPRLLDRGVWLRELN